MLSEVPELRAWGTLRLAVYACKGGGQEGVGSSMKMPVHPHTASTRINTNPFCAESWKNADHARSQRSRQQRGLWQRDAGQCRVVYAPAHMGAMEASQHQRDL